MRGFCRRLTLTSRLRLVAKERTRFLMQCIKKADRIRIPPQSTKNNGDAGGFPCGKESHRALCSQAATSFGGLANHIFNKLKRMVAHAPSSKHKKGHRKWCPFLWWGMLDSDQRSRRQQIYSLPPLAAREIPPIKLQDIWSW